MHIKGDDLVIDGHHLVATRGRPALHVGGTKTKDHHRYRRLTIQNCIIDGRAQDQSEENSEWGSHIRNNGISIRNYDHVVIRNCVIQNCKSGGIVPQHCTDVTIVNCVIRTCYWDAIAPYHCDRVRIRQCVLEHNRAAGVSLDGGCTYATITGCTFRSNGEWDVWARDAAHVRVRGDTRPERICIRDRYCS